MANLTVDPFVAVEGAISSQLHCRQQPEGRHLDCPHSRPHHVRLCHLHIVMVMACRGRAPQHRCINSPSSPASLFVAHDGCMPACRQFKAPTVSGQLQALLLNPKGTTPFHAGGLLTFAHAMLQASHVCSTMLHGEGINVVFDGL